MHLENQRMLGPLILGLVDLAAARQQPPVVMVRGEGVRVFDATGKDYIDAVSGFFCASLGYSEPELMDAAMRQFQSLPHIVNAMHRTCEPALQLADKLASMAPFENAKVCFANSGSEAMDYALKFSLFANAGSGRCEKRKMISRRGSYHGSTIRTARQSGMRDINSRMGLPVDDVIELTQPDLPAALAAGELEDAFSDRLIAELEDAIAEHGAEHIAVFMGELVSFSAAVAPPPEDYWPKVAAILRKNGIAYLDDEVVTGFGRFGAFFACEDFGVTPDMIVCAKGLTSAYQPLAALIMRADHYEALEKGCADTGVFPHASTTAGHPVACAVALKVIDLMETRDVLGHVRQMTPYLHKRLASLETHELVASTCGAGFAGHVRLRPPPGRHDGHTDALATKALEKGYERGVLTRPRGDRSIFCPPLITTEAEIDEIIDLYRLCLDDMLEDFANAR